MAGRLAGKAAQIPATAQGINKAAALVFARAGARIVLADADPKGEAVAEEIRGLGARRSPSSAATRHSHWEQACSRVS